jgi:hypothetical protein
MLQVEDYNDNSFFAATLSGTLTQRQLAQRQLTTN